jgi:hypothetical protein
LSDTFVKRSAVFESSSRTDECDGMWLGEVEVWCREGGIDGGEHIYVLYCTVFVSAKLQCTIQIKSKPTHRGHGVVIEEEDTNTKGRPSKETASLASLVPHPTSKVYRLFQKSHPRLYE